jgi:ADP-ribosyl-[dinitrogen reductase] hydrolase
MYKQKYTGCLLGCAVGDALGMQTEGMSAAQIAHNFKVVFDYGPGRPGSPNEKLKPGQYTDDTEQTLILARTIIESGKFDPALFANKLADHCEKLMSNPELNRGWGSTSLSACTRLLSGTPWNESGDDSPTCGSSMRASPIGLLYPGNPDTLEVTACMSSLPTHRSPESIGGAVAVAVSVSLAVKNTSPDIIIQTAANLANKYDNILGSKIQSIEKLKYMHEINAFSILGTSMMTGDVVPCAVYSFARNPLDFSRTILTAVNAGGDTDSIAAIAGAISGTYLGIDAIPRRWLDKLENRDEIESLALELWEIGKHNIEE